jgi:pantoate--beta-alanine ligase
VTQIRLVRTKAEIHELHDGVRNWGGLVGLVPTMGYLHAGHLSLIEAASRRCDHVTATLFVNPLQFAPTEDLASYPRDLERDLALAEQAGADVMFAPDVEEMYPEGPPLTVVSVSRLDARWEGASRPGHFAGVATIVAKLFSIAGPCVAFFGEKDYQQLQVVGRMAADLDLRVEVVGCPTVREPDGLALSSRNVYLGPEERQAALCLRRALEEAISAVESGERRADAVVAAMAGVVEAEPLAELDYAALVDPSTLEPVDSPLEPGQQLRLLITARVGTPRLLDNAPVTVPR